MGYKIGELFWKIEADTSDFKKGAATTEKGANSLKKTMTAAGAAITAGFTLAVVAGAAKVGTALIAAASEAEETRNKFDVVFSDVSGAAEEAAENLSDNFGMSSNAALQLLSDTGDLLTGFGFTGDAALDLSTQVNELAVDLASFTNFSGGAEGASAALTKALLGERESVKSLGISILDADVKAKTLELTQQGLTFETDRQAQAYATLLIAQEQSKNAIGDFERSSDSFANQTRVAEAAISDLKAAMGEGLLPIATQSVSVFAGLTQKLTEFIEEGNRLKELGTFIETGDVSSIASDLDVLKEKLNDLNNEVVNYGMGWVTASEAQIKLRDELEKAIESYDKLAESNNLANGYSLMRQSILKDEAVSQAKAADEAVAAAEKNKELAEKELEEEAERIELLNEIKAENAEKLKEAIAQEGLDAIAAEKERADEAVRIEEERAAAVIAIREAELNATASIFGSMSSIFGAFADESTEAAIAEKALASASAAINSYLAYTKALAEVPFPANIPAAAAVLASGLARQVNIISTPIPGFEDGGIVGGNSYNGDNVITAQNSGEMNINRADQQTLFNAIKSGSLGGGGTFILQLPDGTELTRWMVNSINDGQGGTISGRVIS